MDDQVLSQTDVIQGQIEVPSRSRGSLEFAQLLERYREERNWNKADLAKRANLDPSSITRFEQGTRSPDRETVLQLSEAMVLPVVERDRLLAAAGFRSEVWDDPVLVEISQILVDLDIPSEVREEVRAVLRMAVTYARLRRRESP